MFNTAINIQLWEFVTSLLISDPNVYSHQQMSSYMSIVPLSVFYFPLKSKKFPSLTCLCESLPNYPELSLWVRCTLYAHVWPYIWTSRLIFRPNFCFFGCRYLCSLQGGAGADVLLPTGNLWHVRIFGRPTQEFSAEPRADSPTFSAFFFLPMPVLGDKRGIWKGHGDTILIVDRNCAIAAQLTLVVNKSKSS